ncbi:eukaryotic peptide chain release factor subunit 1-2 [Histomonas meleagridis]|uniref:eukaryotic peptide chain release factor subunit 1-2 n=1 Tax=Histomonas meleagridis TaxID=135588 RepID=UPI00355A10AD|nr:eukaryotic peptide chain release factor subunit 1-2 [Histomonas meleagridis]KAH0796392.1 eukaryotic peptide chain release factor subunit 1-2 [Histomonas meleagridis]
MPPKARKEAEIDPIEMYKLKKTINFLRDARGDGTSMVTILIPPHDQVYRMRQKLTDELGTASNIKNRVNRQSVEAAITSSIQKLGQYQTTPPNGLCLFCGTIIDDEGKEKKLMMDFEPVRPLHQSLYICDRRFHVEPLYELLETNEKFGFIIMDGQGCLYGMVAGDSRTILHRFSVDLPKKHSKGGQSSIRFARLRVEARHNYVRKVAETATTVFIDPQTAEPIVTGLILSGAADFKNQLSQSDILDPRLRNIILGIYDICYGGEDGFNQTIKMAADLMKDVRLVREQELLNKLFESISTGGACAFGVRETMLAFEAGAIETIILWDELKEYRCTLHDAEGNEIIQYFSEYQLEKNEHLKDKAHEELVDKVLLTDWMAENHKSKGVKLEFVTNKSSEGAQFVKGLGGVGALLRYQMGFEEYKDNDDFDNGFDSDFDDFETIV